MVNEHKPQPQPQPRPQPRPQPEPRPHTDIPDKTPERKYVPGHVEPENPWPRK